MKDQNRPADTTQSERPELERKLPYTPPRLQEYGRLSEFVQSSAGPIKNEVAGASYATL